MAVKGYFYNAHLQESGTYDRLYNDEDFCRYMHNLIGNGVFPTPSTQLEVSLTSGMGIKVAAGDAWIEGHKVQNTEDYTLTIDAADPLYSRIDRVVIFTDSSDNVRAGGIRVLKGTEAVKPVAPSLTRNDDIYELCLAEITIQPNTTSLSVSDLKDTRPDSDICGWVAGLIQQVDTETLYNQWAAAYAGLYSKMSTWQDEMKTQFDTWFYRLSSQLTVGAYIRSFHKVVEGGDTVSNVIPLDMEGYEYEINDIFIANLNGLVLTKDVDYTLSIVGGVAQITLDGNMNSGEIFEVTVLKSSLNQTSEGLITTTKGNKIVYITDAMPNRASVGMLVNNLGETNEMVVINRNLIDFSQIPSTRTVNGITFTNNGADGITINGTTITTEGAYIEIPLDLGALTKIFDGNDPQTGLMYLTFSTGKTTGVTMVQLVLTDPEAVDSETIFWAKNEPTWVDGQDVIGSYTSACIRIGIESGGIVTASNEVIKPMINYATYDDYTEETIPDFAPGTRDTYTYSDDLKPILNDNINTIYSTDSEVSEIAIYYVMLGSDSNGSNVLYPLNS